MIKILQVLLFFLWRWRVLPSRLKVHLKYFYRFFCFDFGMLGIKQKKFQHYSLDLSIELLRQKELSISII